MPGIIRVLYVDDDPVLLKIGKKYLEETGDFSVLVTNSAYAAVELLRKDTFDGIVSDYRMPEMDGISLLKAIREEGIDTPFVIFTGWGDEDVAINAFNSGADFYIRKTSEPRSEFIELANKVKRLVDQCKVEQSLRISEENYRKLITDSNEAILVVQEGIIRFVNPRTSDLTGYPKEELLMMSLPELFPGEDRDVIQGSAEDRCNPDPSSPRLPFRLRSKDGKIHWVELSVSETRWEKRPAFLYFLADITDRKLAEDALRESEERFRTLADCALEGIMIHEKGIILDCNPRFADMFGYAREELIGKNGMTFLMTPGSRGAIRKWIKGGRKGSVDIIGVKKDGTEFFGETTSTKLFWQGKPRLFVQMYDITGRKRAEQELQDAERRLEDIINFLPDATFAIDNEGKVLAWNRAIEEMTGVLAPDMLGKGNYEYSIPFYGERRPILIDLLALQAGEAEPLQKYSSVQQIGDSLTAETAIVHKGGKTLCLWGKAVLFKNSQGEVIGAIESIRDITARKQAEEMYRTVFENIGTAMLIVNENNVISHINEEAEKILGYSRDEIEGRMGWQVLIPPEYLEKMQAYHAARMNDPSSAPKDYEFKFIHKTGEIRDATLTVAMIPGTKQSIVSLRDITELKKMDRHIRERTEQVEELLRQKDEFIAQAGHDLKTPLTPIIALLPHIYKREQDPELRELLQIVSDDASAMKHLISDILTLAQLNVPYKTPDSRDMSLKEEIDNAIQRSAWLSRRQGNTVKNSVRPGVRIRMAPLHLESVLDNLIGNAIRYSPDGGDIIISSKPCGEYIEISVSDHGIGLTQDEKTRVFNEFFKADSSRHQRDSSGLGLTIVRRIAHLYSGDVVAESPGKGKGSTFTIRLAR